MFEQFCVVGRGYCQLGCTVQWWGSEPLSNFFSGKVEFFLRLTLLHSLTYRNSGSCTRKRSWGLVSRYLLSLSFHFLAPACLCSWDPWVRVFSRSFPENKPISNRGGRGDQQVWLSLSKIFCFKAWSHLQLYLVPSMFQISGSQLASFLLGPVS